MRFVWDLLVVIDAERISLLDELPTWYANFFVFFLPLPPAESSDDIFVCFLCRHKGIDLFGNVWKANCRYFIDYEKRFYLKASQKEAVKRSGEVHNLKKKKMKKPMKILDDFKDSKKLFNFHCWFSHFCLTTLLHERLKDLTENSLCHRF